MVDDMSVKVFPLGVVENSAEQGDVEASFQHVVPVDDQGDFLESRNMG